MTPRDFIAKWGAPMSSRPTWFCSHCAILSAGMRFCLGWIPPTQGGQAPTPGRGRARCPGAHASKGAAKSPPTSAPPTPLSDLAMEADWPKADVVIGNPPVLVARKMVHELGEDYTFSLRNVYEGQYPVERPWSATGLRRPEKQFKPMDRALPGWFPLTPYGAARIAGFSKLFAATRASTKRGATSVD
jgi:hypothetical protein